MNPDERIRLEKEYALLSDAQIRQMLADGPQAYVDGAYTLVEAEARRRGLDSSQGCEPSAALPEEGQPHESCAGEITFVELAVLNSAQDKECVRTALEAADIAHNFLALHIRGEKELPAALMVDQSRLEEAVEVLKDRTFQASITLW